MKTLDQMIDQAHAHARRVLVGSATEQIQPFFHIQFKGRPDAIIPAPFSDERQKSAFIYALRMAFKEFGSIVVNYMTVSEAWMAREDGDHPTGLMPSEREDKKEVVMVSAGDHKGGTMKMWEIVRDDQGRVTDLIEDKRLPDRFGGRMFNLLNDDEEEA
jgi:hypothetical protein